MQLKKDGGEVRMGVRDYEINGHGHLYGMVTR